MHPNPTPQSQSPATFAADARPCDLCESRDEPGVWPGKVWDVEGRVCDGCRGELVAEARARDATRHVSPRGRALRGLVLDECRRLVDLDAYPSPNRLMRLMPGYASKTLYAHRDELVRTGELVIPPTLVPHAYGVHSAAACAAAAVAAGAHRDGIRKAAAAAQRRKAAVDRMRAKDLVDAALTQGSEHIGDLAASLGPKVEAHYRRRLLGRGVARA